MERQLVSQLSNSIVRTSGHTASAITKLIKLSLHSLGTIIFISLDRIGTSAQLVANYAEFFCSVLKIHHVLQQFGVMVTDRVLQFITKINSPATIAIALTLVVAYRALKDTKLVKQWTTNAFSQTLSRASKVSKDRTLIRKLFREATLTIGGEAPYVLHPKPRRDRLTATKFAQHIISQTASYEPYHIQPRIPVGSAHRMIQYWASDTNVPHHNADDIQNHHFIDQIDSDYYSDMNDVTNLPYNPQILYTFDPKEVAAKHSDYPAWTFKDDETIVVSSPAEHYEHKLWNYTGNEIRRFRLNSLYNAKFDVFELEKRRCDLTHSLVLINPRVQYTGIFALIANLWYGKQELTRVNVGSGPFARMDVQTQNRDGTGSHTVSVARKDTYLAATCDIDEFQQMKEITENSKLGCTVPKVKTKTSLDDRPAAVLTNYLNHVKKVEGEPKTWYKNYDLSHAIRVHQYYPNTAATSDPNPAVIAFAQPLFDGCHVHSNELGSEIQAIEGRLSKLVRPFTLTAKHTEVMDEYIVRLVGKDLKGSLSPCDDDKVFDKQNKATQQTILEYGQESNPRKGKMKPIISTFAKKEAAGKINDTRIISVVQPATKLRTSKYLYPLAKWLKKQKWYCFGKTPKKIANRLAKIAKDASFINCTDFSRMDGRKSIATRTFNYKLMSYLFGRECAAELREIFEEGCNAKGFTPNIDDECFTFETLMAWASGDPMTSSFNSADNSLVVFTGFVNKLTDCGAIPTTDEIYDEAYTLTVLNSNIAGDDTALADMPDECIVKAASWWGHVLTSEVYQRGESGVNFLARIYGPNLWEGSANSCTDLLRALTKLHTTPNLKGYTPLEKMEMKLTSLYFTDRNSPIIHDLLETWLRVGGKITDKYERAFMSYWANYDASDQYPNEEEDWMWETLPYEEIDDELFNIFLTQAETVDDFLIWPTIWTMESSKPMPEQQVVQTIGDDQELIGEDSLRKDQPKTQTLPPDSDDIVTTPPSDEALKLEELLTAPTKENTKQTRKNKGKEIDPNFASETTNTITKGTTSNRKRAFFENYLKENPDATKKQMNRAYALTLNKKRQESKGKQLKIPTT